MPILSNDASHLNAAPRAPEVPKPLAAHRIEYASPEAHDLLAFPLPSELPAPLTPPGCELRGLHYMPWHGAVLRDSAFEAIVNDQEFRAATRLWWAAWNQSPAGSLPDDDLQLCRLAGKGDNRAALPRWLKIKEGALHGFVRCNDGRLYHPFLCEQALIAWDRRKVDAVKTQGENDRKRKERRFRAAAFAELERLNVTPVWNIPMSDLRKLLEKHQLQIAID